ncbi:unnamed protein product [Rotaria magnacalcarata]|uniref:Uncharacterized protein n=1 Tax=Rotaria magnacalcarata TaxID=392030 RepID=A0A816WZR5_9BILA|nr:unnamed protein product [Rotaria magnacalcarata]CAF2140716.1 unnamed protein product [Rotaria magnacalcarata]CAF2214246.1 unnamed protein product [Rotaria magnacalcarata]CAF3868578.1 unnamed protein product [Rotaria magnacalcarata]CAF3913263.1 unnamed protein product [Rotaria magnacalcarata]
MTTIYPTLGFSEYIPLSTRHYQVRGKLLSIGDHFKIKDQLGNDMFVVRSKILSIGDHMVLEDTIGNGLIKIRQVVLHLLPTFDIKSIARGEFSRSLAQIKQNFTFFHKKFTIDSVYGKYVLEASDVMAHSFTLSKGNRNVAVISKYYLSATDSYDVEIDNNENQPFILALVIVINQILYTFHWQKLTMLR